jgi:hypothetical protein
METQQGPTWELLSEGRRHKAADLIQEYQSAAYLDYGTKVAHLRLVKGSPLRRWHDLLLASATQTSREVAKWARAKYNAEEVEPAYLDPHGFIIIPRVHCTVTMVRVFEMKKEEEVKTSIVSIITPVMGTNCSEAALEYFEHMLVYHRRFEHADMRILAALAVPLALKGKNTPVNMVELLRRIFVQAHPEMDSFI